MEKANFVRSQKGYKKLEYKNYLYVKSRDLKNQHIKWQCERRDLSCYLSIITDSEGLIISQSINTHNHPPDLSKVEAHNKKEEIISRAIKTLEPPAKICSDLINRDIASSLQQTIMWRLGIDG